MRDKLLARLTELRNESTTLFTQRGQILDTAALEGRGLTEDEKRSHGDITAKIAGVSEQIPMLEARVAELAETEQREAAAATARAATGQTGEQRSTSSTLVRDPEVYAKGNHARSYFRDLAKSQLFGDRDSVERLARHARAQADTEARSSVDGMEVRALGNTNTTGGSGGEFAPPEWLVADYVRLARMGRVTADLYQHSPVPVGVSSINIPRVLTGTAVGLQTTQNSNLPATDLTTGSVGTGFTTLGGKQVVSQQLLDQSAIDFDQIITADLAAAYAQNLGFQVIYGAGTGANSNSVLNGLQSATVNAALQGTYTAASPTAGGLYSKAAGLISAFVTTRLAQPTNWLMHPRRFYWLMAQVDANGRPLVVPSAVGFNPIATSGDTAPAAGDTGMTFLGLPVIIDPQLPTNLGAGTNQDRIYLLKRDDLWLFESPTRSEVFRETYADSIGVMFRLYAYTGAILNRYATSIATIDGTGLAAPAF